MKHHYRRRMALGFVLALIAVLLLASLALGGTVNYDINWWTVDGGGANGLVSGDGSYVVSGTIGQHDAGVLASADGSYRLSGGFWGGIPVEYNLYLPAFSH